MTDSVLIGTNLRDLPVQRHFAALGSELASAGLQVALIAHGNDNSVVLDPRVKVLRWPSSRPTGIADILFFDRLVREVRPRCLISNFGAMAIMMTVGGLRKVPVRIHWYHTLSSQIEADLTGSRFMLRLRRLRARIPLGFATSVIANSHASKRDVIETFGVPPDKCQVFWNSIEDPKRETFAAAGAPAGSNSKRFSCVGRIAVSKGQDVLLKAIAEVAQQVPDVMVDIIGDGPERATCERVAGELGIQKNCTFSGALSHAAVLAKMAGSWATIVPSRREAFGLVNIESMAVGVPVIGANTGGIAEIIRDGVDGFLFPPEDHKTLAARMLGMMTKRELRGKMAGNARQRFLSQFELSHAVHTQSDWIMKRLQMPANGILRTGENPASLEVAVRDRL